MNKLFPLILALIAYSLGSPAVAGWRPAPIDLPLRSFHESVNESAAAMGRFTLTTNRLIVANLPSGLSPALGIFARR